jgi:hypothetical protein
VTAEPNAITVEGKTFPREPERGEKRVFGAETTRPIRVHQQGAAFGGMTSIPRAAWQLRALVSFGASQVANGSSRRNPNRAGPINMTAHYQRKPNVTGNTVVACGVVNM